MAARKAGRIINIASMLSFQGGIRVPGYAAAKHALAGLTKALANEWTPRGINVNAIAPGYVATENTKALRQDEARMRELLSRIPAGRFAETRRDRRRGGVSRFAGRELRERIGARRGRRLARPLDARRCPRRVDILVIGGGISGVSLAARLAPRARVALVEAEEHLGTQATGRSAALLVEAYWQPEIRRLTTLSRAFFETPPEGFSEAPLSRRRGGSSIAPRRGCAAAARGIRRSPLRRCR